MTFRITAIALVIFALDTPAFAGGKIGEIRQIDTAQGMAAVSVRGKVREGDSLIATAKDATQCSLMVRSLKGSIAMVDISSCSFGQQLKVGQGVELSLMNTSSHSGASAAGPSMMGNSMTMANLRQVARGKEVMGITVYGFYDNADKLKGDVSGGGQTISNTANSETGLGLGVEYAQFAYRFPGFYAGGAYEFGRDWKSVEAQGEKSVPSPKPTLTMFLLGGGVNFLINDNFYAKAGANYNLPSLASGGTVTDIKGKLGYEAGVGLRFARNFNAELIYRKLNMSASGTYANSNVPFSIDSLSQTGFVLRGGYVF